MHSDYNSYILFKPADEVFDDVSPDHLEPLEIENFGYLRNIELQQGLQSNQKAMTGCQEAPPVQVIEDMELSKGQVENEAVGLRHVQLCLDLIKISLAFFSLFEKLLAQALQVPVLISLFHLNHKESVLHKEIPLRAYTKRLFSLEPLPTGRQARIL